MKTITSKEIIEEYGDELNHQPCGEEKTILEMLSDEPDTAWILLDPDTPPIGWPNEVECPTYVTLTVGSTGPVILSINDAVEPSWTTERDAEVTLKNMGALEAVLATWENSRL